MTTVRDGIHFERKPGDKVKITNVAFDGVQFLHPDEVRAKDERIAALEAELARVKEPWFAGTTFVLPMIAHEERMAEKDEKIADVRRVAAEIIGERDEALATVARQMVEIASLCEGHEVQAGTISNLHDAIKRLASQRDNLRADLNKLCGVLDLFYWFTVELTGETINLTPKGQMASYYLPTTILRQQPK